MTAPKLHHYVPRFYLERFGDRKGKFWVWDKTTQREFQSSAYSIAAESHFYRVPELIGTQHDPQFLEKEFSGLEGNAARIIREWLEILPTLRPMDKVEISKTDREIMSLYVSLQHCRTAETRDILAAFAQEHGPYKDGVSEDERVNLHAYFLERGRSVYTLANRLFRSVWIFARNTTRRPFMTSDNPVCFKTPDNKMWLKASGILMKGVYAVFPLSPEVVLYCHDGRHRRYKGMKPFDGSVSPVAFTEDMVDHENGGQVFMATRFVVSSKRDFDFVRSFFKSQVLNEPAS